MKLYGGANILKGGDIPRRFAPLGGDIPRRFAPVLRGGANLLGGENPVTPERNKLLGI